MLRLAFLDHGLEPLVLGAPPIESGAGRRELHVELLDQALTLVGCLAVLSVG